MMTGSLLPIDIISDHIIPFVCDLETVLACRCASREMRARVERMLSAIPFVYFPPSRYLVRMGACHCCGRPIDSDGDRRQILYPFDGTYVPNTIIVCNSRVCRFNAIRTMVADLKENDLFLLRRPLLDKEEASDVSIPRSNKGPSSTRGMMRTQYLWNAQGQWHVGVDWNEGDAQYQKFVPVERYGNFDVEKDYLNHFSIGPCFSHCRASIPDSGYDPRFVSL